LEFVNKLRFKEQFYGLFFIFGFVKLLRKGKRKRRTKNWSIVKCALRLLCRTI